MQWQQNLNYGMKVLFALLMNKPPSSIAQEANIVL